MTMNSVYVMSAITALTAQNTIGVRAIQESTPEFLKEQLNLGQGSGQIKHNFDLQGKYSNQANNNYEQE